MVGYKKRAGRSITLLRRVGQLWWVSLGGQLPGAITDGYFLIYPGAPDRTLQPPRS